MPSRSTRSRSWSRIRAARPRRPSATTSSARTRKRGSRLSAPSPEMGSDSPGGSMKGISRIALALCLLAPAMFAAEPPPPVRVVVKAARLIDGRGGPPPSPAVVLIENGMITAVGPAIAVPPDAKVVDLGSATLLPGLIDMHDHLTGSPANHGYQSLAFSTPREAIDGVAAARTTLFAGFTTVRNVGAGGFADVALRDAINAGEVPGPRLVVSGPALGI